MIPEGLTRCETCGEYKGTGLYPELPEGKGRLVPTPVSCLCEGLICGACGEGQMHRPISNYYKEATGEIIHVPHFMTGRHCSVCGKSAWVKRDTATA